jgi:hypothetical protein
MKTLIRITLIFTLFLIVFVNIGISFQPNGNDNIFNLSILKTAQAQCEDLGGGSWGQADPISYYGTTCEWVDFGGWGGYCEVAHYGINCYPGSINCTEIHNTNVLSGC